MNEILRVTTENNVRMNKKVKKSKRFLKVLILAVICLFYSEGRSFAETSETGAAGFTYSLTFPENQIEENLGYFSLKMIPKQEQVVKIALSNPSDKKVTVSVSLNGAKTNQNGVIEYGESKIENDPSLKLKFEDLVSGPNFVDLLPKETKDLAIKITIPKEGIEGIVSGGIQLMLADQKGVPSSENGSKILNKYAYVVGMLLQETTETLTTDLKLNSVIAGQNNFRNTIFVNFSNVVASYVENMTVVTQITKKGNDNVLFDRKQTGLRMAPNTFLNFPVSMNGERMTAGKYVAKTLVTTNNQKWEWNQEFEIKQADADKYNERDVSLVQEKETDWLVVILIVISILTIIVISTLLLAKRKKRKKKRSSRKK